MLVSTICQNASESFGATGDHGDGIKHEQSHTDLSLGKKVYERNCVSCHDSGVAGAIKLSDKSTWKKHIHHGIDHMVESVILGKGAMPARGGNPDLSDEEIEAAVHYIIRQTQ
jgi:cytochrome c5